MSNTFSGVGNLGAAPVFRRVTVDGQDRGVVEMRVYFDRSVLQDDGTFADAGGFWLSVSLWGRRAESAARVLRKGARVQVEGTLREDAWEEEDGTRRAALRLIGHRIGLDPLGLESVLYRRRMPPGGDPTVTNRDEPDEL